MTKKLNIATIGCGFMGRVHSNAYRKLNQFFDVGYQPVLKVICDNDEQKAKAFAERWGYEEHETDWRKLAARDDIDLIDICVPNNIHHDMAIAFAEAGKMIACEKPLAMNVAEAREMTEAVEKAGIPNMVWFNYRRVPSIALAKQIVDEGKIGRVFHYRAKYLQDFSISTNLPQGGDALWRLDAKVSGSGVTGDLLSHSIDLAVWMLGNISSVTALTETFVKERKDAQTGEVRPVTIDDACAFLARFDNGALATFEATRYARGRKNQQTFEINGEKGSVAFDIERHHELEYFNYSDEGHVRGWRTIQVWDSDHPYMKHWWVPGCGIGYEHFHIHTLADFIEGLEKNEKTCPDFRDALHTQIVCETVLNSAKNRRWEDIKID